MGRKLQLKQTAKRRIAEKEMNRFTVQKRKELAFLVDKVLKLTSTFEATGNVSKSWELYSQIDPLIREIIHIESYIINQNERTQRESYIEKFVSWLQENGAQFEGVEINEFEGYELGLKSTKNFTQGSLILTIPTKIMMTEKNAQDSALKAFIDIDPVLQNMPNITLALFLLLEKSNPESFWKPYIDILPSKYSTIHYFHPDELEELKPSPAFNSSLKLYRNITRQFAYFYNKIYSMDLPALKKLRDVFTFENYRWAVSTVMTRQNNIQLSNTNTTAFIPLWDMCNHEHGKITTDYNAELDRGECFALRDFKAGEQIFIFYGARSNHDLFIHNGFVYPNNEYDSLSLSLGVSSSDPLRETRLALLAKLQLAGVQQFSLHRGPAPVSPELLAFIRIFNMEQEELTQWSSQRLPGELLSSDASSAAAVGPEIDRRAYTYLLTRCGLIRASYKKIEDEPDSIHRKNIKLLKECEVQILDGAMEYLKDILQKLPTTSEK